MKRRLSRTRGSVLMAVIWILIVLAIFTVTVNRQASQELIFGAWMRDRVQLRALMNAAVDRAIFEIQEDEFTTFDALNEKWASQEKAVRDIPLGDGVFSLECNTHRPDSNGEERILYGACDESARININFSGEPILYSLLQAAADLDETTARQVAQAIVDWRDSDDAALPSGAENTYYKALPEPYEARNGPFETLAELRMVRGVTEEIYRNIEPFITIYTTGLVNFNTAPEIVLRAFGAGPELAAKILEFRAGADLVPGTEDDNVFQHVDSITPDLSAAVSFSPEEFAVLSNALAQRLVEVKSDAFRIQAIGRLNRHGRMLEGRGVCVVRRDGTVLMWQET